MNGKNRPLVTDELVKFEKEPVEVQDFCKITDHLRGIYGVHLKLIKKNGKITTCTVTGWTWKRQDLNQLCKKIFPDTRSRSKTMVTLLSALDNEGFPMTE